MSSVPPGEVPPISGGVFSAQPQTYESTDFIAFSAVVVPCTPGATPILLPVVLEFTTIKNDGGDPGTFNMTLPAAPTYEGIPNPAPQYMKIANPMDVIAIYGLRMVSTDKPTQGAPTSLPGLPSLSITWGQPGFIGPLITATCLFIGMLNQPGFEEVAAEQPVAHFTLQGVDLTKVFTCNDSLLPVILAGAWAQNNPAIAMSTIVDGVTNGAQLLENVFDYMVARTTPEGSPSGIEVPPELAVYSFPWRNFISIAKINPDFEPLTGGSNNNNVPPWRMQDGTAWTNVTDLRNAPINRLFVDEFGNLIFDDAFIAWTDLNQVESSGPTQFFDALVNPSAYTITEAEVLRYRFWMDDGQLVTLLSVFPSPALQSSAAPYSLQVLKGAQLNQMLPSATPTTAATPSAIDPENIQRYGTRYGQYWSFWDVTPDAARNRMRYLVANHDSVCFADITVRGRAVYHVGMRVTLLVPAHRSEFQNATWYVQQCSHSGTYGSTWTTQLLLRYPVISGTLH